MRRPEDVDEGSLRYPQSMPETSAVRLRAFNWLVSEGLMNDEAVCSVPETRSTDTESGVQHPDSYPAAHGSQQSTTLSCLRRIVETGPVSSASKALGLLVAGWATERDAINWLLDVARSHVTKRVGLRCLDSATTLMRRARIPSSDEHHRRLRAVFGDPRPRLGSEEPSLRSAVFDPVSADKLAWLEEVATSSLHRRVRRPALACLSCLVFDAPPLHRVLRTCSLDSDGYVRSEAFNGLDAHWMHPDTEPWLNDLVRHDDDDVSTSAFEVLLRHAAGCSEQRPWVVAQLDSNSKATARESCLRLLLRVAWWEVPGAAAAVQRRVSTDADANVRRLAALLLEGFPTDGNERLRLLDIGDGVEFAEVVRWMVQPGDWVVEDQPIIEVSTDKASVTIGSPWTGHVVSLQHALGDAVPVGAVLCVISSGERMSGASGRV